MQPVQNVVEHLITRNLTGKPSFSPAQVGVNMFHKLLLGQFCRNFAYDGAAFSANLTGLLAITSIMRTDCFPVNFYQRLNGWRTESLNGPMLKMLRVIFLNSTVFPQKKFK
jgi:hypothetical protein